MKEITHIFFDLDHTLWDYDTNARDTLFEIFDDFNLAENFDSREDFIETFLRINEGLWHRYNHSEIDRDYIRRNRFHSVLMTRKRDDMETSLEISDYFIESCPKKTALIPHSLEVLETLKRKYYLSIITNGFTDTQGTKLRSSGIAHFFEDVITSESAGHRKPSIEIFDHSLEMTGGVKEKSVMIGDNLKTDIKGAMDAGWRSIWFAPEDEQDTPEDVVKINSLKEINQFL